MQLIRGRHQQGGLTLVELLIGVTIGIIVIGGATVIYAGSVRNSNDTLKSSRLNQEIGSLLLVVTNDLRRAGFWGGINGTAYHTNPFSQLDDTALAVIDDMTSNTVQGPTGQGSCITYSYDATYLPGNTAGVLETTDLFGFRLNGTTVQMRQTGVVDGTACIGGTCDSCQNGTWADVTDPDLIEVTALTFDLGASQCLNASEPNAIDDDGDGTIDDADEYDCYATVPPAGSNEATSETRVVQVTVEARLAADPSVRASATQTIRVRNDLLRIR